MKILSSFIFLISLDLFAVEFVKFEAYKNNNALLASDIERLVDFKKEKKNLVISNVLEQLKMLESNYSKINSPLSLTTFSKDAFDSGWRYTSLKAKELMSICEEGARNPKKCFSDIILFKDFINNSKLNKENKKMIISFLDSYMVEREYLNTLDNKYIDNFNLNIDKLNQFLMAVKSKPPITIKLSHPTALKSSEHNVDVKTGSFYYKILLYIFAAVFSGALLVSFLKEKNKKKSVKKFYARLFQLGYKSKSRVRIFGLLNQQTMKIVQKIEDSFIDSLKVTKKYASEVHIKVKNENDRIKIETIFHTGSSLYSLIENEEFLKIKMEVLKSSIQEIKGEMHFSSNFNTSGEITTSTLIIQLPLA